MTDIVWGPNGQDVYERTYSRTKVDGSKESWDETVDRVVRGNLALVERSHHEPYEAERLYDLIYSMGALPAGRHLWVTGVEGRQFNRNCHRAGWGSELSDHFGFTFGELMKGGGVGANYSSEYLEGLPAVSNNPSLTFHCSPDHPDFHEFEESVCNQATCQERTLVVEDTREGWVDALVLLVDSFTDDTYSLCIDVSNVRCRGSELKTVGGIASGPGPLVDALKATWGILIGAVGRHLSPMDAMKIDHAVASCVVAGNVRRSARMSILHWRDKDIMEFIDCKTDSGLHWSTNISVEIDNDFLTSYEAGDPHADAVFDAVTEGMLRNGEPGFYNSHLASVGEEGDVRATNPCGEITLEEWESCNLGHINLAAFPHRGSPAVYDAFQLMTRFLLRATFAELTDARQAAVEARNRRIGVGIFGFQEWAASRGTVYSGIHKDEDLAAELRSYQRTVNSTAAKYSKELGIPNPIKTTTVAPTGTVAKLPGVTEGIHPVYARFFERRIRYAENDPKLVELAERGLTIEDCIYSPNTKVVVHHVQDPIAAKFPVDMVEQSDEISVNDMAATQAFVQLNYANNAVSYTMNVSDSVGIEQLRRSLIKWLPHLKGTTVMVDKSRPQSPYTRLSEAEYLSATDHEIGQSDMDCATGACPVR